MEIDVGLYRFLYGTVRLLAFVLAFYDTMKFSRTIVIVRLDYCIHPPHIIRYFSCSIY